MNDMKKDTQQPERAGDVGSTRLVRAGERPCRPQLNMASWADIAIDKLASLKDRLLSIFKAVRTDPVRRLPHERVNECAIADIKKEVLAAYLLPILECSYLFLRLLKVNAKILILRLENRVLLFQSRHLRFCFRQSLLKYRGEWNFFQYVGDYAHNVLMCPNK